VPAIDALSPSPLVHARETAEIVARAYRMKVGPAARSRVPDARPTAFVRWLATCPGADVVAVVGHEPHLGALVYWLLSGESVAGRIAMKKGGACLVELDPRSRAPKATLLWSLTPSIMRRLGD
jgi:phosphohistidine phosphatase